MTLELKNAIFILFLFSPVLALARPIRRPVQLSPEDQQILKDGEMSTTRYVISGILGTYPGFGIGHAIQGRWLQRGWIFTGGEILSGVIGLAGEFGCHEPLAGSQADCSVPDAALTIFAGLKIWEIVDIWYEPYAHDQRYRELKSKVHRFQGFITPIKRGAMLALQYRF